MNKRSNATILRWLGFFFLLILPSGFLTAPEKIVNQTHPTEVARIHSISTNESKYLANRIPQYKKFEIYFEVDSQASNFQLPFDESPPPGIEPLSGVTVDALFSPDNWQTVFLQPAFYYQEFLDEVKNGKEWFYPTGNFRWVARFSPPKEGVWKYKLRVKDIGGVVESPAASFEVEPSGEKGFIRASPDDVRYFEYEDGSYFPGLGYNMNFNGVSWVNPILDNEENFRIMSENGIQLVRIWLSQWGIYGPSWNPWNSIDPELNGRYIPYSGLTFEQAYEGSQVSMKIDAARNPCMFLGWLKAPAAVKRNTDYRIRIRYKVEGISGILDPTQPYGFLAKTGGWLWGEGNSCHKTGSGSAVSPRRNTDTHGWEILEGSLNSGERDFLPYLYLAMENVAAGTAYVDYVWIEEELGGGTYGPNIVSKPWMAHHLYMEQRNSYAFDKALELAEKHDIYFKIVLLEKNDWIFSHLNHEGLPIANNPLCSDQDTKNDPEECPGSRWSYGNWRSMTAVRWLQQVWWRYVQARWGYSSSVHSWELLNEGDPGSGLHFTFADEFGKYMHQFKPNDHLVTTSTWHSFPRDTFWANPNYPNVDYATYHLYVPEGNPNFDDTTLATVDVSKKIGAKQPGGAGMPTMRGEVGFTSENSAPATSLFESDQEAIWLHKFIWGGIHAGGLLESYWYDKSHIFQKDKNDSYLFDYRPHYRRYYNFIKDVPLNNGNYRELEVSANNLSLWVLGQIDPVNGRAHLWVNNKNHTWKNIVDGKFIPSVSGTVTISGFIPGEEYMIQWWDSYEIYPAKQIIETYEQTALPDGSIRLDIEGLATDIAVKISSINRVFLPLGR